MRSRLLVILGLVAAAATQHVLRLEAHAAHQAVQRYEDVYYLPPAEALPWISVGYDEALADLIWMRSLVYFGEELEHGGDVEHVFEYAEAMTALDPRFVQVYRWVGTAAFYRPTDVSIEDMERGVAFMQRGALLFPDDGELAWDVGAALVYEIAPRIDDPDASAALRARGLPYLMSASRLGAAPEWATLSNASLLSRIGQSEQAARHLEEMYLHTADPATRAQIAARIRALRERTEAEAFLSAMEQLDERRLRDFPYLPAGLYLLVGERPPVDVDAPIREGFPRAFAPLEDALE